MSKIQKSTVKMKSDGDASTMEAVKDHVDISDYIIIPILGIPQLSGQNSFDISSAA